MITSKAWDWGIVDDPIWLKPCEDSYYLAQRWKDQGYDSVLDLGSGLGRHSIFFTREGLTVKSLDLSSDGIRRLDEWKAREGLHIETAVGDMCNLPYKESAFDCVFAYHVISHADTQGVGRIVSEIGRVLKPGGEFYLSMCSKESWSFTEAGYPKLDANTIIKTDEGPEKGVPHYYASLDDILGVFGSFHIESVKHVDYCYQNGSRWNNRHYYILGHKRPEVNGCE
jgi:SAM-dependent methyltransferase